MVLLSVLIGTRPEIIKMGPFLRYLQEKKADFELVFSGQHYDFEMSQIFFDEFEIKKPDYFLEAGGMDQHSQMGKILSESMRYLDKAKPKMCVVNGDTNTTLASSIAAAKTCTPLAHIEAGCRSFDLTMPEEINRMVVDRVCSLLFPPTPYCHDNLIMEGIDNSKIFMLGNTFIDAFKFIEPKARKKNAHKNFPVEPGNYVLATFHRQSNADSKESLSNIIDALLSVGEKVIMPLHPRTKKNLAAFGLLDKLKNSNIIACEPLSYLDFISLLLTCDFVISDSGGVMTDCAAAKKRCVMPRQNIELYELVYKKIIFLCHPKKEEMLSAVKKLRSEVGEVPEIYTEPTPSKNIADIIIKKSQEKITISRDFSKCGRQCLFLGGKGRAQGSFSPGGRLTKYVAGAPHNTLVWKDVPCW